MKSLSDVAPEFIEVAHRIVWCSAATTDADHRPRSRVLHPFWIWDGTELVGWIATGPTPVKRSNLEFSPYLSCNYWDSQHDVATAECRGTWFFDDETRQMVWDLFANGPEPVGYDPAMIPGWEGGALSPAFAALRLDPWRLRVFPGAVLFGQPGEVLDWSADSRG
jgi:hypothetical protein